MIEAWSDEETFVAFNGASVIDVHLDGSPHRLADFGFPKNGPWPDPKAMVDELHAGGTKVLLWQIPLIHANHGQARADRETMIRRGYCVTRADGKPYRNRGWWFPDALLADFTNAEARRWWTEKRRYLIDEVGIDGFKTDGGEHAWGSDLRYADGSNGGETNNRYPVLYAGAYHELLRTVTFSRAGFTGSSAYPCHWAGDEDSTWEAFSASLAAVSPPARRDWGWTSPASPARSPTPSFTFAPRRPPASVRSCSTTRSSTTTGVQAVTALRGTSPSAREMLAFCRSFDVLPSFASGSSRTSRTRRGARSRPRSR